MLPINPPGPSPGNCPYSSTSAFAGSPWLISLESLVEDGLLDRVDVQPPSSFNGSAKVDFPAAHRFRLTRLRKAFDTFVAKNGTDDEQFVQFCDSQSRWLDGFALYSALKDAHAGAPWWRWDKSLRLRRPAVLREARQSLHSEIQFHQFVQFIFERQWRALKDHCNRLKVRLIGDIPIFVALDSADVWAHRGLFLLDKSGRPTTVSGYPPDAFNPLGQKWGHPHYRWSAHRRTDFAWWLARFAHTLKQFDAVRIDHFLGFDRSWHVPAKAASAKRGKWIRTPGDELFTTLRRSLGSAAIIAEDLGQMTDSAARLRDKFNFPGMRVLQFGFGADARYHHPDKLIRRCVAYTGTHDNNTIVGWYRGLRSSADSLCELKVLQEHLPHRRDNIHWTLIQSAMKSAASTVIFPVQDILGLGEEARMNVPGTIDGNWSWRLRPGQLSAELAKRVREMAHVRGRT